MEKVLTESPEQMIKFKTYKRGFMKKVNIVDHRLTRVRNVKKLSYGIWANLVVQSILSYSGDTVLVHTYTPG